jgi:hypothetical protein
VPIIHEEEREACKRILAMSILGNAPLVHMQALRGRSIRIPQETILVGL